MPNTLFDGATFDAKLDGPRATSQLAKIRKLMRGGRWWTLQQLAKGSGASEAGASARIRDLRKVQHGGHEIKVRRVKGGNGLHEYRMVR